MQQNMNFNNKLDSVLRQLYSNFTPNQLAS